MDSSYPIFERTKGYFEEQKRIFVKRKTDELRKKYVGKKFTFCLDNVSERLRSLLIEGGLVNGEQYEVREVYYEPVSEGSGKGLERAVSRLVEPVIAFEMDVHGKNVLLGKYLFIENEDKK